MKRFALVVAILALGVSSLNASTVNFRLKYNGVAKTWNLYASTSGNEGISLVGVILTNVADAKLQLPKAVLSMENMGARGFDNSIQEIAVGTGYQLGAAQDVQRDPAATEYGVGITPGVVQGFAPMFPDAPYDAPVLVASGKLVGAGPFDRNHLQNLPAFTEAKANVYIDRLGRKPGSVVAADVTTEVVPEPSTMVLAAFGLLSLVALGFRRSK